MTVSCFNATSPHSRCWLPTDQPSAASSTASMEFTGSGRAVALAWPILLLTAMLLSGQSLLAV